MKKLYFLLLLATYGCVTSRKVDRYYFIAEEQISLYEFASFKGRPVLTANVGDTIASTGPKVMQIGGTVPVDYKGFRFYSPYAKARFISKAKIDPKLDNTAPGISYLPKIKYQQQTETRLAEERQSAEAAKVVWYGQVANDAPVLDDPVAIAETVHTLPANAIIKIKRHNYNYWQVEYDGKVGYLATHYIRTFSKSSSPFVKTEYTGSLWGDEESEPRTDTPTTGATIHTGPRGGRYYINSHGNKTYVPRNGSSSYGGYRSSGSYRSSGGRGRR